MYSISSHTKNLLVQLDFGLTWCTMLPLCKFPNLRKKIADRYCVHRGIVIVIYLFIYFWENVWLKSKFTCKIILLEWWIVENDSEKNEFSKNETRRGTCYNVPEYFVFEVEPRTLLLYCTVLYSNIL